MGFSHISDKMYIVEIHNMANISKPRFPIKNKTMIRERRPSICTDVVYSYFRFIYSFFSYELQLYLLDCVRETNDLITRETIGQYSLTTKKECNELTPLIPIIS